MGDDSEAAAAPDSVKLEYERIQGELEAAMVFASAAEFQSQKGDQELAATCRSEAAEGYTRAVTALAAANLSGAQLQELKGRLLRLQQLLDTSRTPGRHQAA